MTISWESIKSNIERNIESTDTVPINSEIKIFYDGEEVKKSDLKKLIDFVKNGKLDEIMNQQ
ncbi:MAG: hypothetical protein RSC33_00890 [Vagococcus sp.]